MEPTIYFSQLFEKRLNAIESVIEKEQRRATDLRDRQNELEELFNKIYNSYMLVVKTSIENGLTEFEIDIIKDIYVGENSKFIFESVDSYFENQIKSSSGFSINKYGRTCDICRDGLSMYCKNCSGKYYWFIKVY